MPADSAYLNGPVPFSAGSWSYVAEPLAPAAQLAGASFSTLVGAPLPNGATGSLLGVYTKAGVEQMVITAAFSSSLPQFRYLAHGIITWATRGVHFGYNRNNLTFNVDDAFSSVALWNSDANCTPGEDCTGPAESSVRMTPADVTYAVNWMQANGYQLTLAFNGAYADAVADPLTQALQANAPAFRWLNHGAEHLYQGCVQDFSVVPWQCTSDANGIVWMSQPTIYNEIANNIAIGRSLGLPFDATEYLSGEHSGLFLLPQQPADNPNFARSTDPGRHPAHRLRRITRQRGPPGGQRNDDPAPPDSALLQHRHASSSRRRIQLAVQHARQRRQRLLRGQPGNGDLHRTPRSSNWIHVVHRADRRRLRPELHPQQRPAAVLRPHLEHHR